MSRPTCTASAGPSRGARTVTVSGQARLTLEQAFERFESTVTTDDRRLFQDTRLEHVRNAALEIEQDLATRRSLRNMRRLQPFLQGLEHYSKAIEVLCNGTPYLSWIWAPVKLMLQITSDHLGAFEKLIEAYGKIGDALPRFDRLSAVLKDDHNFQAVLALMYADVLEFHRRAYKFVRRRGWKFFFSSMWDNFDSRFKSILADLAYHSDLVDKEAVAVDIAASLRYQKEDAERFEKQEQEWKNAKLSAALSWLGFGNHVVDHIPDNLTRDCSPGACDWIFKHAKMEPWLQDQGACSIVWLCGKPGAGKSVLTASLVHHLEELSLGVYCYFCSYSDPTEGASAYLFRSLVAQIIQIHPDAAIHVAEKYINSYRAASNKAITCLLPELLDIVGSSRLVIDGIDEWDPKEQQIVMDDILTLATGKNSTYCCKVIISSRDMPAISSRIMRRNKRLTTVLSLSEEQAFIDQSIQSFIDKRLDNYRGTVQVLDSDGSKLSEIRRLLVTKSNGMFLWVKLVLDSLEFAYTPEDLRQAVVLLPSDLTNLYKRILRTICGSPASQRYIKVVATLQWIAFACRPIKMNELLHGLAHASGRMNPNSENIPVPKVLELCKPLVEQRLDGTVSFIHFSVQEYLQSQESVISGSAEAHHIISSTCVATLSRGLELLHPDLAVQSRMITITRGVYGLMMYSLEFWQHHVLSYAEKGGDLSADSTLTQSLLTLCSTHERIQKAKKRVERSDNVVAAMTSPTSLDVRLPLIKHPAIHELLYESLQLRHASKEHSSLDGKGNCRPGGYLNYVVSLFG
ncbi:hypothetical protein DM02DRAFT_702449 [Periconia macrospinosa]|uniref:Uncharacterized protein n=1 Tax=Periconia macrospinosa TaxID=97972 RepID=A0A2V1DVL9_9PLEO|nr:hypothetical protein DM02DRAFT_702449 [Periconia macrospinosa]